MRARYGNCHTNQYSWIYAVERHLTPIRIVFGACPQYSFAGTPLPVKVEFDQNGQILLGCLQTYLHAAFTSKEMGWGADIANYT